MNICSTRQNKEVSRNITQDFLILQGIQGFSVCVIVTFLLITSCCPSALFKVEVVASPNGVNHNTSPANHKATSDQQLHTSTYIPVVDVDSSVNLIIILWEKTHTQIELQIECKLYKQGPGMEPWFYPHFRSKVNPERSQQQLGVTFRTVFGAV